MTDVLDKTLVDTLHRIDGRGYKAYKDVRGSYRLSRCQLFCDYIQGDPFASPSRIRLRVEQKKAQFPSETFAGRARRKGLEDYIVRQADNFLQQQPHQASGTGKSGMVVVDRPGQQVLESTAAVITEEYVELRVSIGLPARGRTVLGRQAEKMFEQLDELAASVLYYGQLNAEEVWEHVCLAEDQEWIRSQLASRGLAAFAANGSVLPRRSGVDDRPMEGSSVVPFAAPDSMAVTFSCPHNGDITGMGIPEGVTVIVGGGFHGKSTLLQALQRGIYDHTVGDGRQWVITRPKAVKIRAEDGRYLASVDISPFINQLPFETDTREFSSVDASGSTSQAANIMESLEMGADLLLLDEDTSATNFMIRDVRMQKLVAKDKEPITPFVDMVRPLYEQHGVSTIMVVGGSGDYLEPADQVIMMDEYRPVDMTKEAKAVVSSFPSSRVSEQTQELTTPQRIPGKDSIQSRAGKKKKTAARGLHTIQVGRENLALHGVEQLVHPSQTRAIAELLRSLEERYLDGRTPLETLLADVYSDIAENGWDIISPFFGQHPGDLAEVRPMELAAALNRLRTLQAKRLQ